MSGHGAPPPPPSHPSVTCRVCGCLNFGLGDICEGCRSSAPVFRRTARQSAAIRDVGASSNSRLKASSAAPQRASQADGGTERRHGSSHGGREERHSSSAGRKRRFGENGERSSTTSAERSGSKATANSKQPRIPPTAKKQPVVIDLLSSSDDEAEDAARVAIAVAASLDTSRSTAKTSATSRNRNKRERTTTEKAATTSEAFQSRVFPAVEFVASDFPTVEMAAAARKAAGVTSAPPVAVDVVDLTPPSPQRVKKRPTIPTPATTRPPPAPRPAPAPAPSIAQEDPVGRAEQASQGPHPPVVRQTPPSAQSPSPPALPKAPSSVSMSSTASRQSTLVAAACPVQKEAPRAELFQSRRLEFQLYRESDFVTVFDGLAVARRSRPPTPKATAPSTAATLTPAASAAATPTPVAIPSVETAKPAVATSSQAPPTAAASAPATTASTPAIEMPRSAVVTPAPVTERTGPTPSMSQPVEAAPAPATATPTSAATNSIPAEASEPTVTVSAAPVAASVECQTASSEAQAATTTATATATTPTPAVAAGPAATPAVGSTSMMNPVRATPPQASANVLLPKKKHPLGDAVKEEPQRRVAASSAASSVSADTAAATNPIGSSAQTPARRVKAPLLGHCSADFLELMREFGDEDADDDPEEARWALLDVVDLTNLSDSEDNHSDAESSVSSPTNPLRQPVTNAAEGAGQSTTVSDTPVASTTSWHAPGLGAAAKRPYQPEKVDCEICGESGLANRLIRCPTCTKYYHRKCAREQGDATKCWICELGMMIDDSDLTEEEKERQAEYTSAFRHSPTRAEESDVGEEDGAVEMTEAPVSETPFAEATRAYKSSQRWKAFMEEDTADIDASFDAVTARITLELRTEEANSKYSKGFVTREELDAQLTELEEFYIDEHERLERERAKEKEKTMAAASASGNGEQREGDGAAATSSNVTTTPVREEGGVSEASATAPIDASSNTGMTATSPSSNPPGEAPPPLPPTPAAPPSVSE